MQRIIETIFDAAYLAAVLSLGILMIAKSGKGTLTKKFGIMAVVLGGGDAFHLVPRMVALWTSGLEANAAALGVGKLITSITMTAFYVILYYIWRERYGVTDKRRLTITMWSLAALRVALCLLPQNQWLSYHQPLSFGVLRNVPFALMGILIIVLFATEAAESNERTFRHMWLAVSLSFAFYIPVVLFSAVFPLVGVLMIPKTLAYFWIVWMGWNLFRKERATAV
jgi:hypothetical protein